MKMNGGKKGKSNLFQRMQSTLQKPTRPAQNQSINLNATRAELSVSSVNNTASNNKLRYTKEELTEYKEAFALFDKDGSGAIGYSEMEEAMYSLGMQPSKREVEELIREVDVDGNGEIDFDEFCLVMKKLSNKKDTEDEIIRQCFEVFDQNFDGLITEQRFKQICIEYGDISPEIAERVFREADVDGSRKLDYDEFKQLAKTYLFED